MALNPALNEHGDYPLRIQGEFFILQRNEITFEVKSGPKVYKGEGECVLTTYRLVMINKWMDKKIMSAFDIPLSHLIRTEFKKPKLYEFKGKSYISGQTKVLYANDEYLPQDPEFKMVFNADGCGTFMKVWNLSLKRMKEA